MCLSLDKSGSWASVELSVAAVSQFQKQSRGGRPGWCTYASGQTFFEVHLEIENHLARDAVFAKMEGQLRSPEQDILFFTLIYF